MSETKDWRKICADCQEGELPKDCEYFGEPGGCNAPTMGKHPTCKESLQVGNIAAMREALDEIRVAAMSDYEPDANYLIEKCNATLSSPPRNVDRFNTPDEALSAYCEDKGITQPLPLWYGNEFWAFIHWLFAEAKGGEK